MFANSLLFHKPIAKPVWEVCEVLSLCFFCRPAEVGAPDLVGCRFVICHLFIVLLLGLIVQKEVSFEDDLARHTYCRLSTHNEVLVGEPWWLMWLSGMNSSISECGDD